MNAPSDCGVAAPCFLTRAKHRGRADIRSRISALLCVLGSSLTLGSVPSTGAEMQETFVGDGVRGTVTIPSSAIPRFGFVPVRVVTNSSRSHDLHWQLTSENTSFVNNITTFTRTTSTVVAPGGRMAESWIFLPSADAGLAVRSGAFSMGYGHMSLTLQGTGLDDPTLQFHTPGTAPGGQFMVPWAVSASLESIVRPRIYRLERATDPAAPAAPARPRGRPSAARPPTSGPHPLVAGPLNLSVFDPSQPLGDWRIWSAQARVILREEEFLRMPPASRAALRGWVALGGMLYLVPDQSETFRMENVGAGSVVKLAESLELPESSVELFGPAGLFNTTRSLPYTGDMAQLGGLSSQVSPAKRASDWLVYFFIGFALLIGPVNLFAIAPTRRRHRLFVTMPAMSLSAVGVLFAAIYLQDGIGGEGARRSLVVLLPGDNQAAVFQDQISRTGLLMGSGFAIADDTICAQVPLAEDTNQAMGRQLKLERQAGVAHGDWFRARNRQAQHLRRLTPTRARVERVGTSADGAPIVQSSVATELRDFCFCDHDGITWRAESLPSGQRVTLTRSRETDDFARHTAAIGSAGSVHLHDIARAAIGSSPAQAENLRGRFVATAGDSDLAPIHTLAAIRWNHSAVTITGLVEGALRKATP